MIIYFKQENKLKVLHSTQNLSHDEVLEQIKELGFQPTDNRVLIVYGE